MFAPFAIAEVVIPLTGALVAVLSSYFSRAKNNLNDKIIISLGDGSKVTIDGSEESQEKVRQLITNLVKSQKRSGENSE